MENTAPKKHYWILGLVFLIILIIGFGPQFFWRPLTGRPPLSLLSFIHAVFGIAWVMFYSFQSLLIKNNQIFSHKKLGIWGSMIGVGLIVSTLGMVNRTRQEYYLSGEAFMNPVGLVIGNTFAIILFTIFVALGFKYRYRPLLHKQFMSIGTVFMLGPAIGRLSRYPATRILDDFGANEGLWAIGGSLLLFLTLIWMSRKRWVSILGLVAYILMLAIVFYLMVSGKGMRIMDSLK